MIDNEAGEILLVRKRGTKAFMQAGGKIEAGESRFEALARELYEELNLVVARSEARFIGEFACEAANEPGNRLEAHVFHVRCQRNQLVPAAELSEAIWVTLEAAAALRLAPLTRDYLLPIAAARRHSIVARTLGECHLAEKPFS